MREPLVVLATIALAFGTGFFVSSCGSDADAREAKEQAARWQDSTAVLDAVVADLTASQAYRDSVAADSVREAQETARAAQEAAQAAGEEARAARGRAARLVARMNGLVSDSVRALLAEHVMEDSVAFAQADSVVAAKDRIIGARDVEIRQLESRVQVRDELIEGLRETIAARDSVIGYQAAAIRALEKGKLSLFGIPIACSGGGAAAAGAGGQAAGVGIACGLKIVG